MELKEKIIRPEYPQVLAKEIKESLLENESELEHFVIKAIQNLDKNVKNNNSYIDQIVQEVLRLHKGIVYDIDIIRKIDDVILKGEFKNKIRVLKINSRQSSKKDDGIMEGVTPYDPHKKNSWSSIEDSLPRGDRD